MTSFNPAQADAAVGPARNAADIAAVGGDGAVALAVGDLTDVRLPHDAAGIVIPTGDGLSLIHILWASIPAHMRSAWEA